MATTSGPRLRVALLCLSLLAMGLRAEAQTLRVVSADGALAQAEAFTARGYPAFPLTLLTPLGAEITKGQQALIVTLFGDTIRFRAGQAAFWADGYAQPLYSWTFEKDDVLFVAQRFFTEWLPRRYPERISLEDSTLRLVPQAPAARAEPAGAASHQSGVPDSSPSARAPPPPREPAAPVARDPERFYGSLVGFVDVTVSGVYDSNIDRDPLPQPAYGMASRVLVGVQSARSRPFFMARYDLGVHRFPASERWNRTTHDVTAEVAPAFRRVRLRLTAAVRIGSWTEDRELANQIVLRPQLEARVTNTKTVNLYVAQRSRRISSGTETRSDTNRIAGAWFYQWWHDGGWLLDGRYEINASERASSRFEGWFTYSSLRIPITSADRVRLVASYGHRRYPDHFPGGGAVAREDHRWTAAASLSREFADGALELGVEYGIEQNRSNEPYAAYMSRRFELTVRCRW